MSSPVAVPVENQFDALQSSPRDDSKEDVRSRKDDIKEQMYQAREGVKAKAIQLKEEVVSKGVVAAVSDNLSSGLEFAKGKIAAVTGKKPEEVQAVVDEAVDQAEEGWDTVKSRGKKKGKKLMEDVEATVDEKLDEKLTPAQRNKLNKGVRQAKQAGKSGIRQAEGLFARLLSAPQLRGVKSFIWRNNLQTPAMILTAVVGIWLSLTLIRLVTMATTPSVPEFDIHSKEASMNWLKYHAGEYKDQAVDLKDSLTGRVAKFLANHEFDKIKADAIDWKDIGMRRLGLAEPTYTQQAWAWMTGKPTTWQGRVESVLDLGLKGLKATALKKTVGAAASEFKDGVKDTLGWTEPSYFQRASDWVTGTDRSMAGRMSEQASGFSERLSQTLQSFKERLPGQAPQEGYIDSLKHRLQDGVDSVRSHLPGGAEAIAEARAKAYAATHPSTLDNIKSGAEYIKNRVLHGSQEAAHIAQDRMNEAIDKAKYKTGL